MWRNKTKRRKKSGSKGQRIKFREAWKRVGSSCQRQHFSLKAEEEEREGEKKPEEEEEEEEKDEKWEGAPHVAIALTVIPPLRPLFLISFCLHRPIGNISIQLSITKSAVIDSHPPTQTELVRILTQAQILIRVRYLRDMSQMNSLFVTFKIEFNSSRTNNGATFSALNESVTE